MRIGGTLNVSTSTFSGNRAASFGGGINNGNFSGPVAVTNSTFSGNSATTASGAIVIGFPGISTGLKSTIFAASISGSNCSGPPITDQGFNISTDASCAFAKGTSHNNVPDTQLKLGLLQNNGGPTKTIALGAGSLAIDTVPVEFRNDQAMPPNQITTDQRGSKRPDAAEGICDIGAYEFPD